MDTQTERIVIAATRGAVERADVAASNALALAEQAAQVAAAALRDMEAALVAYNQMATITGHPVRDTAAEMASFKRRLSRLGVG